MDFSANKQDTYEKRIASLPDQPNMQPDELKAYFDSSPEQLRQAHNGLCDALTEATSSTSAAAGLGFQRTAGVPADNVQAAVENVQAQLNEAVMGNIPSGSVTEDKLAQDVRDRFAAIESAATAEASARASADSQMQGLLSTHTTQIAAKCEVYIGTYIGNGTSDRIISLGFKPKAVLLFNQQGQVHDRNNDVNWIYGGLCLENLPIQITHQESDTTYTALKITATGFQVAYSQIYPIFVATNDSNMQYAYLAFH